MERRSGVRERSIPQQFGQFADIDSVALIAAFKESILQRIAHEEFRHAPSASLRNPFAAGHKSTQEIPNSARIIPGMSK